MRNGYELHALPSAIVDRGVLDAPDNDKMLELCRQYGLTNGWALFYRLQGPCWARIQDGELHLPAEEELEPTGIEKARLFNEDREILIWIDDNRWRYRVRVDGEGEPVDVIDADQMLLGQAQQSQNGFTWLWETQGGAGWIPLALERNRRAKIATRNYIGYVRGCQAGFFDCRFMNLLEGEHHG